MLEDQKRIMLGQGSTKEVDQMCVNLTKVVNEEFDDKRIRGVDYNSDYFNSEEN